MLRSDLRGPYLVLPKPMVQDGDNHFKSSNAETSYGTSAENGHTSFGNGNHKDHNTNDEGWLSEFLGASKCRRYVVDIGLPVLGSPLCRLQEGLF